MHNLRRGEPTKKRVRSYDISYSRRDFIGRSLFGEIRLGYQKYSKKVHAIRINPLPISQYVHENTKIQDEVSVLKEVVCQIIEVFQTQSNRYTVMEYFPKTFKTELGEFQKSTKYLNQMLEKFFQAYSTLYHLRFNHGNISLENIGICFDGTVKLMDFRPLDMSFEQGALKDYRDFRSMMCTIMLRDKIFPEKLEALDRANSTWNNLFSAWHVVSPYHYLFISTKHSTENSLLIFSKMGAVVNNLKHKDANYIKVALKLLMLQYYQRINERTKGGKHTAQIKKLTQILAPLYEHDIQFYNSILWGILTDPEYFDLTQQHRLALICAFIEGVNHEYLFMDLLQEFQNTRPNLLKDMLLSNNLIKHYNVIIKRNMLKEYPNHSKKASRERTCSTQNLQ